MQETGSTWKKVFSDGIIADMYITQTVNGKEPTEFCGIKEA